jgi:FtsH-binding integral membrane protein
MQRLSIEIRYAFFISASTFIWLMLEYLLGFQDEYVSFHPVVSMVVLIFPIAFTFVALRKKRDEYYEGVITFGQAFQSGIIIAIICAVFTVPIQYIFHYAINPRFFDVMIEESIKKAINNGKNFTDARQQAEAYFNITSYIIQSVVGTLIIGLLLSALFSWGVKRSEAELEAMREKLKTAMPNRNEQ